MAAIPGGGDHHQLVTAIPKDILVDVLTRVALESSADLLSAKLTCKALLEASAEDYIYRHVTITEFPVIPWKINLAAVSFLDRCITSGNPEALFRQGLIEYLSTLQIESGLQNLRSAAQTGHPESIYVCGILMLCQGQVDQGIALLCSLEGRPRWVETVRYCRKRVKSIIGNMWIRNFMIMAAAEVVGEQNRGRICGCRRGGFAVPPPESVREGWASREDEELELYAINRCRFCFWNHEAAAFCIMLRFGSFQF